MPQLGASPPTVVILTTLEVSLMSYSRQLQSQRTFIVEASFMTIVIYDHHIFIVQAGNTKGRSIIVSLKPCLTGLDLSVLQIKTKIVSCHTANSKPVKQEVRGTVILPPLSIPCYRPPVQG
jgi:hypothetical protein